MAKAFVTGCASTRLEARERDLFRAERPWGLILFARNVGSPAQLRGLVDSFRDAVQRPDAPVLIDQEGGRVQRLRAPFAPDYPTGAELGALWTGDGDAARRATYLLSRLHAFDLAGMGIDINCLPVLDLPTPDADEVIGSRAYASSPERVSALGRAACDGLLDGGVLPVVKHMPGHGRADADSHKALPTVDATWDELDGHDFVPFKALRDMPIGMSAHVRYTAIDPDLPGTVSKDVIGRAVRGAIGFDNLLLSDDISMHALSGPFGDRTRDLLAAGCDIALHCNGLFDEMVAVAEAAPELSGTGLRRAEAALSRRSAGDGADEAALRAEFHALTGREVWRPAA